MQIQIVDKAGHLWNVRRTCVDIPERAYFFQRQSTSNDVILPGVIGFYAASIDDAKNKLTT